MAMLTPAQKPRGFARMIFKTLPSQGYCHATAAGGACQAGPGNGIATPGGVAMHNRHGFTPGRAGSLELHLGGGDDVLVAVLGDLARHRALFGLLADGLVEFLLLGVVGGL